MPVHTAIENTKQVVIRSYNGSSRSSVSYRQLAIKHTQKGLQQRTTHTRSLHHKGQVFVSCCLDTTQFILRTARNMTLTLTYITVHYVLQMLIITPQVFSTLQLQISLLLVYAICTGSKPASLQHLNVAHCKLIPCNRVPREKQTDGQHVPRVI